MNGGLKFIPVAMTLLLAACAQPAGTGTAQKPPGSRSPDNTGLPASATKLPHYTDALKGLYPLAAAKVPADVPVTYYAPGGGTGRAGRAVLTMALVPGPNYARMRDYLAQAARDAATAPAAGNAGAVQTDLNPQPVLARAVEIVKERYPWLELTDDVSTARARDASLTLVLDIRSRLGKPGGDPTAVQIELIAFDDSHKPVSRILTEGKVNAGGANGYNFQAAAKQALDALESKSASELD